MDDVLAGGSPAQGTSQVVKAAAAEVGQYDYSGDMLKARMPFMVKGAGYVGNGNKPLRDEMKIVTKAHQAALDLRVATYRGYHAKPEVVQGLNPAFLNQFGHLKAALTMPSAGEQITRLVGGLPGGQEALKSFTANDLGIGTTSGIVPFDLLAPSRLIYPMYTVFRNKFPRPAGQGTSRMERVFTGISGSQTGGQGVVDIAIPELVQAGGNLSSSSWPLNLPGTGGQTEVTLNVPYRFFGLTESLSWLAQFAGQGFEDISALANLILMQEMMMGEEYMMLAGTSTPVAPPTIVAATARAAGSKERAVGAHPNIAVLVTATNYYGETTSSAPLTIPGGTVDGQVVDVTIGPSAGALMYNIYVSTAKEPCAADAYRVASGVGGVRFTIQGQPPVSGVVPPTTDTSTGKNTRMEGIIPTLTGKSAAAGVYPAGWQGGYVNQSVGAHLSYNVIYSALDALWENWNSNDPGAFRADPAEIVGDGGDIMRLSQDIIANGMDTNYRLMVDMDETSSMRVGAAVSEFQNPITRSVLKLVVHPWLTQGTAMLMTYQLPQAWTNVANAWEMTCVQDYVSIAWPVIDASFRYSIFLYGALVSHAPFYSGLLQGIQASDSTPYS
ncbi:hypothetical protein [Streptomyces sp. NPDC092307]|uniref:hypothetical protein n=1 Tax=Streptomyces sp. NPDC092307 TaxID=3366013 RepID=UPI0037F552ED